MAKREPPPNPMKPLKKLYSADELDEELHTSKHAKNREAESKETVQPVPKPETPATSGNKPKQDKKTPPTERAERKPLKKEGKTYKQFYISLDTRINFEDMLADARRYILLNYGKSFSDTHLLEMIIGEFHKQQYKDKKVFNALLDSISSEENK